MVCRRLLWLSLNATKVIELDWRPTSILSKYGSDPTAIIRKEAAKIQLISKNNDILNSVKVCNK